MDISGGSTVLYNLDCSFFSVFCFLSFFLTLQQHQTPVELANGNKEIIDLLNNPDKAAEVSLFDQHS